MGANWQRWLGPEGVVQRWAYQVSHHFFRAPWQDAWDCDADETWNQRAEIFEHLVPFALLGK